MDKKIILDLCGGTGGWSKFYNEDKNYDVRIIDFNEWGENNFDGDIRFFKKIKEPVYGILAAPPCTHFAGSGARWWKGKGIDSPSFNGSIPFPFHHLAPLPAK